MFWVVDQFILLNERASRSMAEISVCEREVMSVRELANFMGVSTQWVYQNKSKIPHRRVGNLFFFHRDAIREWLSTDVSTEADPKLIVLAVRR